MPQHATFKNLKEIHLISLGAAEKIDWKTIINSNQIHDWWSRSKALTTSSIFKVWCSAVLSNLVLQWKESLSWPKDWNLFRKFIAKNEVDDFEVKPDNVRKKFIEIVEFLLHDQINEEGKRPMRIDKKTHAFQWNRVMRRKGVVVEFWNFFNCFVEQIDCKFSQFWNFSVFSIDSQFKH